jgi:two-component system cell cycle sensor histidine kinase/response regulator CckA
MTQPFSRANEFSRRRTILLVEDEPFVREATCGILAWAGFEVLATADALDALRVYKQRNGRVDLVMTDMVLPGQTGQQLGQALREQSPEVVVLVTSGYTNLEYEVEAPQTQTYFLAKPYSKRTLLGKIDAILGSQAISVAATQAG